MQKEDVNGVIQCPPGYWFLRTSDGELARSQNGFPLIVTPAANATKFHQPNEEQMKFVEAYGRGRSEIYIYELRTTK